MEFDCRRPAWFIHSEQPLHFRCLPVLAASTGWSVMSAVADQAAVKEYISKYQLEDELSAAVNMAIKANSDNPFKLISDYLKTLADPESDDDADDDDDDMMEEEEEAAMPATKPRGRRAQVMAVKVDIPADFKPPVYPKSPEIEAWLSEVMDSNKLMKMLSPSDRKQLMLALKEVTFNAGDKIIKQGDAGDNFYILDQGAHQLPSLARPHPRPQTAPRRKLPSAPTSPRKLHPWHPRPLRRVRHPRRRQGLGDEGQEGHRLRRAARTLSRCSP